MNLYGPVRVDKSVGTGKATVTLSMKWEGVSVASTTHTINVAASSAIVSRPVSARLLRSLPHADRNVGVFDVHFLLEGKLFTSGLPSGIVQVWDPVSGKELRRIDSPKCPMANVAHFQTTADFRTLFVPTENGKLIQAEGTKPARVDYAGKILVWDLATGEPKPSFEAQPGYGVSRVYVSPDGSRLITTEHPGRVEGEKERPTAIRMIDTTKNRSWKLAEGEGTVAYSSDGRRAYVAVADYSGEKGGGLLVFDREGKELAPLVGLGKGNFNNPLISPDGKWLVVANKRGSNDKRSIKVFDLATGKDIADLAVKGFTTHPASFSPDGRLLATHDTDGTIEVYDPSKRSVVLKHKFAKARAGSFMAFSKDSRLAVPVQDPSEENTSGRTDPLDKPQPRIYLFDLAKPKSAPEEIVCPHGSMGGLAFSADGKVLAFGSTGAVHLFEVSGPAK